MRFTLAPLPSLLVLLALWGQLLHAQSPGRPAPQSLAEVLAADATLHDVTFIDAERGWAVGDRGVVLHTPDGGRHWERQAVPVGCPLLTIDFVDAERGWCVGGDSVPMTHRTRGVVLRTIDGGRTWQQVPAPTLPRLTGVRFFDAAHGLAIGYGGAFYPSGLFATGDGGKSWQPLAASQRATWLAADFVDPASGALAGIESRGVLAERELQFSPLGASDPRRPRDMRLASDGRGWLVGEQGLIATTTDGGASWQPPAAMPLPPAILRRYAWHTVAMHGSQVWLAGSPGSAIFHSSDGGATWTTHSTGCHTPIEQLHFVDAERGWAVGALGTILATRDGGQSWQVQRASGSRAALVVLCASPEHAPLEIISRHAAGEGYRTVVVPLFGQMGSAPADRHRQAAAIAACGGELIAPLWTGDTPAAVYHATASDLLAELDRQSDGTARDQLQAALVSAVRTWRPAAVLVPHERDSSRHAASAVVELLASEAVNAAADPQHDVEFAKSSGLAAWQVQRVVGLVPEGDRGSLRLPTDDFVPTLGGSPSKWATTARGLLFTEHTVPASTDQLELLWQVNGLPTPTRDLFTGLNLLPGGDARRAAVLSDPNDLDRLRRLTQKRGQLVRLLDHAQGSPTWAAQVVNLTGGLDPQSGGELLFQLAEGYRQTGRTAMAADTLYLLARRYPDHPLTEQSLVWLVQYYASGELAQVATRRQALTLRTRPLANVDSRQSGAANNQVVQTSATLPGDTGGGTESLAPDERFERAGLLGKYLEQTRPAVFAEPALRFPLAVAARGQGFVSTADKYFVLASNSHLEGPWRRAAMAERWLAEPAALPPEKPLVTCRLEQQRPRLDGQFDEAIWARAEALKLGGGRGEQPAATVRFARDDEFLYVAIACPRLPNEVYDADNRARTRDADLSSFDRVRLALDMDRDYGAAYELTVDCRGWTHDAVWGDATWNPTWYVASTLNESQWTAEIAIPWSQLAEPQPAVRDAWAVRAERLPPRGRAISWTGTTGDSPDSFGLLLFR